MWRWRQHDGWWVEGWTFLYPMERPSEFIKIQYGIRRLGRYVYYYIYNSYKRLLNVTIIDCNHELLLSNWPMFLWTKPVQQGCLFPCQEEGGIGEYNRANRSLGQFVENVAGGVGAVGNGWGWWSDRRTGRTGKMDDVWRVWHGEPWWMVSSWRKL